MEKITFNLKNYRAEIYPDTKEISIFDKVDQYNEPMAYSTKKRGFKKASEILHALADAGDCSTFGSVLSLLNDQAGVAMHSFCRVD